MNNMMADHLLTVFKSVIRLHIMFYTSLFGNMDML